MTAGNYATLFFIGLMLIAVEWMRLSVWAAGLFIFGTVLNGVGAATRVDGITVVSFAIMLAGAPCSPRHPSDRTLPPTAALHG
jgi:hypothetical protein